MEIPPGAKFIIEHTEMPPDQAVGISKSKEIENLKTETKDLMAGVRKLKKNNIDLSQKLNNLCQQVGINSSDDLTLKNFIEENEWFIKNYEEIIGKPGKEKPIKERTEEKNNLQIALRGKEYEKQSLAQTQPTTKEEAKKIGEEIASCEIEIDELHKKINLLDESLSNPAGLNQKLKEAKEKIEKVKGVGGILESQEKIERNKEQINLWESHKLTNEKIVSLTKLSTDFVSVAYQLNLLTDWYPKYENYLANAVLPKKKSNYVAPLFEPTSKLRTEIKKNLKNDLSLVNKEIAKLQDEAKSLQAAKKSPNFVLLQITHLQEVKNRLRACQKNLNPNTLNALLDTLEPYSKEKDAASRGLERVLRELTFNEIYRGVVKNPKEKLSEEELAAKKEEFKKIFPEQLHSVIEIIFNSNLSLDSKKITPENTKKMQDLFNIMARYSVLTEEEIKSTRGQLLQQELNDTLEEVMKKMGLEEGLIKKEGLETPDSTMAGPEEKTPAPITVSPEEKTKITSKLREKLKGGLELAGGLVGWSLLLALVLIFYGLIWATDRALSIDVAGGTKKK